DPAMAPGDMGAPDQGQPAPPVIVVVHHKIDAWARGIHAWPYMEPEQVWRGDIEAAVKAFEAQIAEAPLFNLGHTWAAAARIALGDVERGIALQRAWTEAQEPNGIDQHNYGVILQLAGRTEQAIEAFRKALTLPPAEFADDAAMIGILYLELERYPEAVEAFKQAATKFPAHRRMQVGLGEAQLLAGQAKDAVATFQKAIAMDPEATDGYLGLVDAYLKIPYRDKAITVARRAADVLPGEPAVLVKLAEARLADGRLGFALDAAQKAVQAGRQSAEAQQILGEVYFAQNAYDQAVAAFEAASRAKPTWNKPKRYLARTKLYAQDYPGAAAMLQQAMLQATDEDMPETARDLARVSFYQGDFVKALEYLRLSDDYEPSQADALMLRSFVRLYQGDEAGSWADFVAALDGGAGGRALIEAQDVFNSALTATPARPMAHVPLGMLLERAGQIDQARSHFRRYKAEQPKGYLAEIATERLAATDKRH
ncbi:MAG: tetratricopeptide repeat protein, partial [Armatimonadetes bacterium]|nr:tetratricopeptide repeat protein [Armatimonadota bacterium]